MPSDLEYTSTGTEVLDLGYWIYNRLITDSLLNNDAAHSGLGLNRAVFNSLAPVTQSYPICVFKFMSGTDTLAIGTPQRLMTSALYLVKVMVETAAVPTVKPVTNRIDALMNVANNEQFLTLSDGTTWHAVVSSRRQNPYELVEQNEGNPVYHTGGIYKLEIETHQYG